MANEMAVCRVHLIALLLFIIQGCASVDLDRGLSSRYNHLLKDVEKEISDGSITSVNQGQIDVLEGVKVLEIERAIEISLINNPDLISMKERIKEALEKYPQVTALDDPTIGIGFYPGTIGSERTDFSYKVDIAQRFPYPGKLGLKGEIALKEAEAVWDNFRSARLELVRMVKTAYFELFYVHKAIEINREERRILKELKSTATFKYAAGKGNLQAPTQAEMELALVEHRRVILDRMLRVATARLNTLMGRMAGLPLPHPLMGSIIKNLPDKETIVEQALSRNPEIKAARSKRDSAKFSVKLADLQYYPDFRLMGSYNNAWMTEDLRSFIGIGLNIPFQLRRLNAQKREAEARLNRADFEIKAVEDRVRYQVEEAFQKLKESAHATKLFREILLPAAELNLNTAEAGYREGKNDFLTLITAEKALVESRLRYERIIADMRIREAALLRTIGE